MAKLLLNSALKKVRGGIDDWVYRRVGSRMVISPKPEPSTTPPSAGQIEARNRFRAAEWYARAVLADPIKRAVYDLVAKLAHGLGILLAQLPPAPSAAEKLRLADRLKPQTSASNGWIAQRLQLGATSGLASRLHRFRRGGGERR